MALFTGSGGGFGGLLDQTGGSDADRGLAGTTDRPEKDASEAISEARLRLSSATNEYYTQRDSSGSFDPNPVEREIEQTREILNDTEQGATTRQQHRVDQIQLYAEALESYTRGTEDMFRGIEADDAGRYSTARTRFEDAREHYRTAEVAVLEAKQASESNYRPPFVCEVTPSRRAVTKWRDAAKAAERGDYDESGTLYEEGNNILNQACSG